MTAGRAYRGSSVPTPSVPTPSAPTPSAPAPSAPARSVPDRVWVPAMVGLVLSVVFVAALLVKADGDVSLFVHAGPQWTSADDARGSLTVQPADQAFDGQFFYRLGVAPWSTTETVAGVTNDLPSLRNARWGYGALAWVGSAGDPDLVPWALVGLNVAAAAAIGAVGGGLARSSGRHAAWGALFVLWPGFAYSLSLDTSELVASAFVLGGLLALRHRRWLPSAALLTAAVITRDTMAVIPFGIALTGAVAWLTDRPLTPAQVTTSTRPRGGPVDTATVGTGPSLTAGSGLSLATAAAGAIPLVAFGIWQLVQRERFGALPLTSSGDNNLSAPLGGLVDQLTRVIPPDGGEELFRLACIGGLVALLAGAAWAWRRSAAPVAERVAWIPAVAVVVLLNDYLWSGATAFMRASTEAGLLSILILLGAQPRRPAAGMTPRAADVTSTSASTSDRSSRPTPVDRMLALTAAGLGMLWVLTALAQLTKLA